ncbi:DNA replication/repair protein RecF [SAR202 cluster bacterium AD-802-E10_MRT_200m]|nr:DNA replication/repair protein RecF [SAR202 cluster bacterium AD-802-E10_MRT_200m]
MFIRSLKLKNFRNYIDLEIDFVPGLIVLHGGNGQGKSNLLEAMHLLSLTKSYRTDRDREIMRLGEDEEARHTRIEGAFSTKGDKKIVVRVDLSLSPENPPFDIGKGILSKRINVNGISRRALNAVGTVRSVLFTAEDIELVVGPPSVRRRFLDVLLSQIDRTYLRTLRGYQKILVQRNHLLRLIAEGNANLQELEFWDGELASSGAFIMAQRMIALSELSLFSQRAYRDIVKDSESIQVVYETSVEVNQTPLDLSAQIRSHLQIVQSREIRLGKTLIGPHRDDIKLLLNGVDAAKYTSRGQQRSLALAIRLGEAYFMYQRLEEEPILLLDDVLSEIDSERQEQILQGVRKFQQSVIAVVEPLRHVNLFDAECTFYHVRQGGIELDRQNE